MLDFNGRPEILIYHVCCRMFKQLVSKLDYVRRVYGDEPSVSQ